MKILHVITSLAIGGAEKLMVDLLPRLRDMGNNVDLLLFDGTRTPFYDQLQAQGIKIYSFSEGGNVYNPLNIIKLMKYIGNYDVVHTHNTACQLFAALASVVYSVVLCTTEHTTSNRRRDWKWYHRIDKWMYSRYSKVICISDQAEKNLIDYIDNENDNITTIYNGVDIKRFIEAEKTYLLPKLPQNCVKIIMVAGFRYQKDQLTLIKAMSMLGDNYHLLLVGDGERRKDIENLINTLDMQSRVHLLGTRTDVPQLLKTADVIVMSSHFEGLSLSNIEGMACGKPFIASDVDGLREITSGYGIMFPHEDYKQLAFEIKHLMTDKLFYAQVAKRCQDRAKQFDISIMAEKYNEVYKNIIRMH